VIVNKLIWPNLAIHKTWKKNTLIHFSLPTWTRKEIWSFKKISLDYFSKIWWFFSQKTIEFVTKKFQTVAPINCLKKTNSNTPFSAEIFLHENCQFFEVFETNRIENCFALSLNLHFPHSQAPLKNLEPAVL